MHRFRIAIIAGVRFDTREPHAGGLERHTDVLARHLAARGHSVTVFAGAQDTNSQPALPYAVEPLVDTPLSLSDASRADVSMPPELFMMEHDAYLDLAVRMSDQYFDVVHNNSLHYLPVVSSGPRAMVHTLHTPPTPWLESAHRIRRRRLPTRCVVVSVSADNARRWGGIVDRVIHNGIDLDEWRLGGGSGGYAFWSGRLVPEKGPDLAIAAARAAGLPLLLAGPIHDIEFFEQRVKPRLGDDCVYVGHCSVAEISSFLAEAVVALVTPRWDEPFGLVVAEALACGTPVAGFGRGAIPELLNRCTGAWAGPDDVVGLVGAIARAASCDRRHCRAVVEKRFSATRMAASYERVYTEVIGRGLDAEPTTIGLNGVA